MVNSFILTSLFPQRIVILRALQLGDMMTVVPAVRALRALLPESVISLIGLPWAREFVQRFSAYFDDFIEFPGYPGLPEIEPNIARIPDFLSEVQWLEFDLGLQMQGSGAITNNLIQLFGARHTAGFYTAGQYCPEPDLYLPYPASEPEILRHLRLVEFLGAPSQGEQLEFPLCTDDWEELHDLQAQHHLSHGTYAIVHPGSRHASRRWPAESFAQVADALAHQGLQVVLTGTTDEAEITATVAEQMQANAINLTGQTSLGGLGALLSQARILVSNDTGVSHVADALRVPSVVLFTGSDPKRWAPLDHTLHPIVPYANSVGCEVVMDEVENLLKEERVYVG